MIVLVTGGTGTLGTAIVRTLFEKGGLDDPMGGTDIIRVLGRDDTKHQLYPIRGPHIRHLIGDVRDMDRMRLACRGVDWVFHCAALKHVDLCEYNPSEAVLTNVMGTLNMIRACEDEGVDRMVLISTDKAVDPTSTMGATKLLAERVTLDANKWGDCSYSVARLGNVLGSRGALHEVMKHDADILGYVRLTDKRMRRYFITPEKAAEFIIGVMVENPKAVRVAPMGRDLPIEPIVRAYAKKRRVPVRVVGMKDGEKLKERLQ